MDTAKTLNQSYDMHCLIDLKWDGKTTKLYRTECMSQFNLPEKHYNIQVNGFFKKRAQSISNKMLVSWHSYCKPLTISF